MQHLQMIVATISYCKLLSQFEITINKFLPIVLRCEISSCFLLLSIILKNMYRKNIGNRKNNSRKRRKSIAKLTKLCAISTCQALTCSSRIKSTLNLSKLTQKQSDFLSEIRQRFTSLKTFTKVLPKALFSSRISLT